MMECPGLIHSGEIQITWTVIIELLWIAHVYYGINKMQEPFGKMFATKLLLYILYHYLMGLTVNTFAFQVVLFCRRQTG